MTGHGVLSYGVYVPTFRLARAAIAEALDVGAAPGTRAVASYDEDAVTMAVEAGRRATRGQLDPSTVLFATATPPYLEKTNATTIHAALGLPERARAFDALGSVRSGAGALLSAFEARRSTLVALSDVRTGLPGSTDESEGGDAAAGVLIGPGDEDHPVLAELIGDSSCTREFLDRWRLPGDRASKTWEERFGEQVYVELASRALADALTGADLVPAQIDHLVVAGLHSRAVRSVTAAAGVRAEAVVPMFGEQIGNSGTAQLGIGMAVALERASPGDTIALVSLADGADVLLLSAGEPPARNGCPSIESAITRDTRPIGYTRYLGWRGLLEREPPRRPDPIPPSAPAALRRREWKYGFTGTRCEACGTMHLPPCRTCVSCHAVDRMRPERVADVQATVATYAVDRLAASPSPPVGLVVLDFDGGGRYRCELTDCDVETVDIGTRVEMTFRRLFSAGRTHNYFWKARPAASATHPEGA